MINNNSSRQTAAFDVKFSDTTTLTGYTTNTTKDAFYVLKRGVVVVYPFTKLRPHCHIWLHNVTASAITEVQLGIENATQAFDADLLWRFVSVVFLAPQLGVHLEMNVLKVDGAADVLHVTLSDVIVRLLRPVIQRLCMPERLLPAEIIIN